jgi:hypothetical protein
MQQHAMLLFRFLMLDNYNIITAAKSKRKLECYMSFLPELVETVGQPSLNP